MLKYTLNSFYFLKKNFYRVKTQRDTTYPEGRPQKRHNRRKISARLKEEKKPPKGKKNMKSKMNRVQTKNQTL